MQVELNISTTIKFVRFSIKGLILSYAVVCSP